MKLALVVFLGQLVAVLSYNLTFPPYKQCDSRWGDLEMGVPGPGERATICREGCAMTCLATLLAALGVQVGSDSIDPASLNTWLMKYELYVCLANDCNNLVLDAAMGLSDEVVLQGEAPPPPFDEVVSMIEKSEAFFLAHVRNGSHFVLVTGVASTNPPVLTVHDPNFNVSTYPFDEVVDFITFTWRAPGQPTYVFNAPMMKQCDVRWGQDVMVTETICQVGCLMSSVSMALHGFGIRASGQQVTPEVLNTWLQGHSGYDKSNDLQESSLDNVNGSMVVWPPDGMHTSNDLTFDQVRAYLLRGRVVIANVMHGHHFVLATGFDRNDTVFVNDPGFDVPSYSYSQDVVGWRLFDMKCTPEATTNCFSYL